MALSTVRRVLIFTTLAGAAAALLASCMTKPTKVSTQNPVVPRKASAKGAAKLGETTVILDVRPAFEFNVAHIPRAINVSWEDFSRHSPEDRGLLEKDLHPIARRLALVGIDPETPVLVVGKGLQGRGEEGRVAWTLESLGVSKVQLAPVEAFREKKDTGESEILNKKFWTPALNSSLAITWDELHGKIEKDQETHSRARSLSLGGVPSAALDRENWVVLDVRSAEEVSIDNLPKRTPRVFRFHNIEWKDFFTEEMDPNPDVLTKLKSAGITADTEVDVISNHGVRSGAVTWALQRLGFKKARNFAGGYEQVRF